MSPETEEKTLNRGGLPWSLLLLLAVVWASLSASLEPLLLSAGGISLVLVLLLHYKFRQASGVVMVTGYGLSPWRLAVFLLWLLFAIVKSNLKVMWVTLKPGKMNISPKLIKVPARQRGAAARALLANSITLTPGTVSVDVSNDSIMVHSLFGDDPYLSKGGLDSRICGLERKL